MRFTTHKRRTAPTVIIVSLIDVLLVVLIFLMVTTTFKDQRSLKLALPESTQSKLGSTNSPDFVVTIDRKEPFLYIPSASGLLPVTQDRIRAELTTRFSANPDFRLTLRADSNAPFGQIVKVMDIAKEVGVKSVNAFTRKAAP